MTCVPGLLETGLSLAGVPRSALPPGIKGIQARNLDLDDTISKHPCACMGTPQDCGKEEPRCLCAFLQPTWRVSMQTGKEKAVWSGLRSPVSGARMVQDV